MILLLIQILLDATGDVFRLKKRQILQHVCESLQIAVWFAFAYCNVDNWIDTIIFYVALRFAIFDLIWNLWTGQKWYYVGLSTTSIYGWFMNKFSIGSVLFLKFVALFLVVCEIINLW